MPVDKDGFQGFLFSFSLRGFGPFPFSPEYWNIWIMLERCCRNVLSACCWGRLTERYTRECQYRAQRKEQLNQHGRIKHDGVGCEVLSEGAWS